MAQRWEHLPHTAVAGVGFLDLALLVGKFVVDSRPRSEGFSPFFFFPSSTCTKTNAPNSSSNPAEMRATGLTALLFYVSHSLKNVIYFLFIFYACSLPHLFSCKKGYASDFTVVSAWGANPCRYYTASKVICVCDCYATRTKKKLYSQTKHTANNTR